jgi:hypothetical protein
MPNIEAAIAEYSAQIEAQSEATPETDAPAQPPGTDVSEVASGGGETPAAEKPNEEQAVKLELLRERIASIQAKRKAAEAAAAQREWEQQRNEHREALGKDPKKALAALGFDPVAAYDAITEAALAEQKPENLLKNELIKELEPIKKQNEELKARLEAQERERAMAHRAAQESAFLRIVGSDAFELLRDEFSDDSGALNEAQLIAEADRVGNELAKSGKPFTLEDIAGRLLSERSSAFERYKAIEARRQQREATKKSAAGQTAEASKPASGQRAAKTETGTVSNQLASATASADPELSREQRRAKAEAMLGALLRKQA